MLSKLRRGQSRPTRSKRGLLDADSLLEHIEAATEAGNMIFVFPTPKLWFAHKT